MATSFSYDYGKENALVNEFDAWVGLSDPMPDDLARGLASCSSYKLKSCMGSALRRCDSDALVERLQAWLAALSYLNESGLGRPSPAANVDALAWELPEALVLGAEAVGIDAVDKKRFMALGKAMSVARKIEKAMGWGTRIELMAHGTLEFRYENAAAEARRKSSRGNLARAMCWHECARAEGLDVDVLRDAELEKCLVNPSSWRWAAELANMGGEFETLDWGKVRQLMNCALGEHAGGAQSAPPKERVSCVLALLAASGSSVEAYRGRSGERFGAFALGSLWSNPSKALVEELSLAGVEWSDRDLENLAAQGTRRLATAVRESSSGVLGVIDAAASQKGVGPFSQKWLALFKACQNGSQWSHIQKDLALEWGDAIGRWAIQSRWKSDDLSCVEQCWPEATRSPAFKAAKELASIAHDLDQVADEVGQSRARSKTRSL